ncbi:unnamed protein product (macronuclear) [Paramecium tetraurelia]|uniref:BZIP domain-containing protein n=1 Tax=Paramecium tetraurelia TaxID=5888 RepID=A0BNV9_PARTE|nr:uncharacterized protein GSPATT00030865001 [Paramecium tetraurelia]CAK60226.1 unnamed protein product [Paramecium tetraurelia]|eukprot:XP_001427624.1 hypothetical protein (macronuclear) [Paramecium tetraurelia strain d4-2]
MKLINQNESIDSDSNDTIPQQEQPQALTHPNFLAQIAAQNCILIHNSQESTGVLLLNRRVNVNQRLLNMKRRRISKKKSQSRNELLKLIVEQDLNDLFDI